MGDHTAVALIRSRRQIRERIGTVAHYIRWDLLRLVFVDDSVSRTVWYLQAVATISVAIGYGVGCLVAWVVRRWWKVTELVGAVASTWVVRWPRLRWW